MIIGSFGGGAALSLALLLPATRARALATLAARSSSVSVVELAIVDRRQENPAALHLLAVLVQPTTTPRADSPSQGLL